MASNIVEIQLLLFMAGSCLAGTNFRISSANMVATEGSSVSLQCRFSYQYDNRYLVWLYVPPGQAGLKKLLYWEPGAQQPIVPAGSTGRYLGTKDFNNKTTSLQISRAMSSDTSRYYCQITDNLWDVNATDWCGCGISLSVERIRPPSIQLLAPFLDGAAWSARATLVCQAVGFYPETISFRWMVDRRSHSLPTEHDEPVRSSSGTYNATSRIHIPFPEWDRIGSVNCLVTHVSKTSPFIRKFQRPVPDPQPPVTFLLRPLENLSGDGASVTLTCGATGFYPATISFGWEVEGSPVGSGIWNAEPVRTPNGTYHAISTLNTPRSRWESGTRYTCLITHQELDQPIRKNISIYDCDPVMCVPSPTSVQSSTTLLTTVSMETDWTTVVPDPQPPVTFLLRPLESPSGDGASVTLTCGATGFYPATISFGWEVKGSPVGSGIWNVEPVRTPNGTYLSISNLNTPRSRWESGTRYTCLITHQELDQPIRKNISIYDCDPVTCVPSPTPVQSSTTLLTTVSMETDWTTVDGCRLTWYPSWLWVVAAVAVLVIYTGIVLCIFHGIWTCRQRRRGAIPESLWVNLDIPMEKIPEDVGKGL